MLDVGIDFGSTYTTVSIFRRETVKPEAKALTEGGSQFIPSVVAVGKNDKVTIGRAAKQKRTSKVFRAFKMMLAEDDQEKLSARGFDSVYTPYRITQMFLRELLEQILKREEEFSINSLVICAPEIWNSEITAVDGRARLRDICKEMPFVRKETDGSAKVQVVSEPAAASAYFASNFLQETGENFSGHLLLIDYGGGTLDITLTDIEPRPDKSGKVGMEIKVLFRTGAGENEEMGKVGKAGIVYMETLMRTAIMEVFPGEDVPFDADFCKAVDDLEEQIQGSTAEIGDIFNDYGTDPEDLTEDTMDDEYIFGKVYYRGNGVNITYRTMAEVYDQVIRGVLNEKMDEVNRFMVQENIEYMDRNNENFKIVIVGGFGNFYLVQSQVEKKYQFSSTDLRRKNMINGRENCEKAISLGAALLSGGAIRIRNTAPFSIGIAAQSGSEYCTAYALRYNQDIEFNKEYIQSDNKGNPVTILSTSGSLNRFIINMQNDERAAFVVGSKYEYQKKLKQAVEDPSSPVVIGFSIDASGVLTLHVHSYDIVEDRVSEKSNKIELSSFRNLFDTQRIERVWKDDRA